MRRTDCTDIIDDCVFPSTFNVTVMRVIMLIMLLKEQNFLIIMIDWLALQTLDGLGRNSVILVFAQFKPIVAVYSAVKS